MPYPKGWRPLWPEVYELRGVRLLIKGQSREHVTISPFVPNSKHRMDISSRELDLQKVDKEIQDAFELVRRLRTRRNTLAPISRLPTEILSRIFTTLAHSFFVRSRGTDLSWIRSVTAVCGHWRATALACPNLWCFIGFKWPIWTEEMLKRSKMAPLTICANDVYFTPNTMSVVHSAFRHLSRTKALHIIASKDHMHELFDCIDKRAPLLQSLCLCLFGNATDGMYTLPENLFVAGGHHLERLELRDCNISWNSPLLLNLVHLKLDYAARPTITQLLDAFERMPLLETLDLRGSLPAASGGNDSRNRVIRLSHLTSLRLSSTASDCANLLDHISYPTSTCLHFRCKRGRRSSDLSTLFQAISSVWNGKDGSGLLRSLAIDKWSSGSVKLRGWTVSGRSGARKPPCESVQIEFELTSSEFDVQQAEECFGALTLSDLRELFVDSYGTVPKATWKIAFGNATSLRSVRVVGPSAVGFVYALRTGLEENPSEDVLSSGDTGEIFLPNLHSLWLEEMVYDFGFEILNDLRDCLVKRRHWHVEVRKLHLGCTRMYYRQVELLREVVAEFDVGWREIKEKEDDFGFGGFKDEDEDSAFEEIYY